MSRLNSDLELSTGILNQLKNYQKMDLESAIETRTYLISKGWKLVKYEFNDEVD